MHVLIVSAWDPTSGVLTVYRSLARHLGLKGVRFSAFAFDGWGEDTWWTFCEELIDGRSITLAEVLMSGRYDLLHCVDTTYAPPYGVEKWVRRARFHGPVVLMAQVARRELREPVHATRYVACSDEAAEVLALDADRPVQVITNGYDDEVFVPGRGADRIRPLLVWVGRSTDPQKDVGLFLEAMELLPACDAVLLDGHGGDADTPEIRALMGSRIERRTLLVPAQVAEIFRAAAESGGAFVSTSRYEGFSLAAVEAMACGCPVVAPRVPGYGHLADGSNAIVFDRSAGPQGIVEALHRLHDPGLRAEVIAGGHGDAVRWTSRQMAEAYLHVYEDALASATNVGCHKLRDSVARTAWRAGLAVRPAWHRARRLIRG